MEADEQHFKNQQEFRGLLEKHGISQFQAAKMITKHSLKNVAVRTVRCWLAKPEAKSALYCTDWAVKELKDAIAEEKKRVKQKNLT